MKYMGSKARIVDSKETSTMTREEFNEYIKYIRSINVKVHRMLMELGVSPGLAGYEYIKTAVELVYTDNSYLSSVTTKLYPAIAQKYYTSTSRVERCLRYAIEESFSTAPIDVIKKYFGNTTNPKSGKVTNKHFIAAIVEYLKEDANND